MELTAFGMVLTPAPERRLRRLAASAATVALVVLTGVAAWIGMFGTEFHASNASFQADGLILEPTKPETLVDAVTDDGPLLLGALFEMPEIGQKGPAVGGPLTVWHAHDHVCFSLTPPALAGLTSPWGTCPIGSITIPVTGEMIHVWTLPGVPEPFGDIDDAWLAAYLNDPTAAGG